MRSRVLLGVYSFVLLLAKAAGATESVEGAPPPPNAEAQHEIDRTWLYADDARIPAPLTAIASSQLSYTSVGGSPTRTYSPYASFAGNTAQPGAMMSAGGELGLFSHVSLAASAQVGAFGESGGTNVGALAGLRVSVLPDAWKDTHLVLGAGYLREAWQAPIYNDGLNKWLPGSANGGNGAWLQGAFSANVRRVRLAATVHGEHVFVDGRDPIDLMVNLGVSYRVVGGFRAGVEYVGQDLEESVTAGSEKVPRHFVGPAASMQLLDNRLTLAAGPGLGLSSSSPQFVGRMSAAYGF